MDLNFCYFGLFWFCHGFCSLAKTTRKPKNKKIRPMDRVWGQGLGRGLAGDMGLNCLFVFCFPMVFFAVWPGGAGVQIVETRIF